jgi:hypothetical protein
MRRLLLAAGVALCPQGSAGAASDFSASAVGTTGSQFLTFDVGARGIAMGGAYTAATNDAYSLYWNPAGLAKIPRASAGFMYTRYVEDINYQSGTYAQRVNDSSVLAGGFRYQDIGNIPQTDISDRDIGAFRPRNYIMELGWGQSVYDLSDSEVDIDLGVAARWLRSDLMAKADSYSADLGLQSRFYSGTVIYDLAFVIQNIGRGTKFDKQRDSLPMKTKLGGAIRPIRPLLLSLEAGLPIDNAPYGAAGAEYTIETGPALKTMVRAGFNSLTLKSLGPAASLNFGMGLSVSDLTFDYAFSPLGVLGAQVHRFSVTFNLPAKVSRRQRER